MLSALFGFIRGLFSLLLGWVAGNSAGLVTKILSSLGIGTITYIGLSELVATLVANVQGFLGGLPAELAQLVYLSGIGQGIGLILSAIVTRITLVQLKKFGLMTA